MTENKDGNSESRWDIPYIVYEGSLARAERIIKKLIFVVALCIILIVATNGAWLWYINQYDFMTYEYEQDGRGINIIGDSNGVDHNGSAFASTAQSQEEER